MNEELKFKIRQIMNKYKIVFLYFFKEPFYEVKRLIRGYYNSTLVFWLSVILFVILWKQNIGGITLKIAGILVLVSYFYMFERSGNWKEYYEKEYIEGGKIE